MEKLFSYNQSDIYYKLTGKGDCVILLHGFLEDHSIWDALESHLIDNYKVLSLDIPGHGKSDCIVGNELLRYTADLLKSILELEGISSCSLIGHSMGGYVAAQFAFSYPSLVDSLTFFHSHAKEDSDTQKINRERTIEIVNRNMKSFISNFIPELFAENNQTKYQIEIQKLKEVADCTSKEGVINALEGMKRRNSMLPLLIHSTFPIAFILGKKDSRIPLSEGLVQASLPSHSEILILDNVGHMGWCEAPELTNDFILSFLDRSLRN